MLGSGRMASAINVAGAISNCVSDHLACERNTYLRLSERFCIAALLGGVMRERKFYWIPMALAGALICPTATFPNDSAAELSIGGLRFTRTNEITIDSEELRISIDRVDVRYQFTNTSGKPVTLTVAFPLPDIDLAEAENIALPSNDPVNL